MVKMYGIPNCDIIKKAAKWLQQNNIAFELHDYKKEGISAEKLKEWSKAAGWETIFNKRSTTWKEIMNAYEGVVNNQAEAIQIMQQHTSIIKRPVIETGKGLVVGYDEKAYQENLRK
ncbi:MAG: Spx/MgsR family RNA polymerase-binding regulatory protein [Ferruginibacter sp.]